MADHKSCEGNHCIKCGQIIASTVKGSEDDKESARIICDNCYKYYDDPKNINAGTITVDIDCADALKGLKAIQREAKKATAALKELEEQQRKLTRRTIFNGEAKCPKCGSDKLTLEESLSYGKGVVKEKTECGDCGWSNHETPMR